MGTDYVALADRLEAERVVVSVRRFREAVWSIERENFRPGDALQALDTATERAGWTREWRAAMKGTDGHERNCAWTSHESLAEYDKDGFAARHDHAEIWIESRVVSPPERVDTEAE